MAVYVPFTDAPDNHCQRCGELLGSDSPTLMVGQSGPQNTSLAARTTVRW